MDGVAPAILNAIAYANGAATGVSFNYVPLMPETIHAGLENIAWVS